MLRFLSVLLLLPSVCFAQAKAVVDGPTQAEPGDLVVINAEPSVGEGFRFVVDERLVGRSFVFGKQVIFATRTPGTYRVQVIVADRAANIDQASVAVKIGEELPPEPPKPPGPPKPPPLPPVDVDPNIRQTLTSGFSARKADAAIWSGMLLGMARVIEQDATKPSGPRLKTMADIDRLRELIVRAPSQPVSGGDLIGSAIGPAFAALGSAGDQVDQSGRRLAIAKVLLGSAAVLDEVSR
jgi:hypothetical protein